LVSQFTLREEKFNDLLLEAVDEALSSLGEPAKVAIYRNLRNTEGIEKSDIPRRIADFSMALEKIFGLGAQRLEIQIMKNLHAKIEVTAKWPANKWLLLKWTLQMYVRLMRQNFEAKKENKTEMEVLLGEREELRH
jgi:DNA-binding transcriptional ArsR family regulator